MGAVSEHPPALWQAIRRAYEGRDPAYRTKDALRVEALAAAFGVHANSIFTRCKERGWQRPAWYEAFRGPKRGPKNVPRSPQMERRARLIAVLRQAASRGEPCPATTALLEAVCVAARTLRGMLTALRREGVLFIEYRDGYSRRARFADGTATDWSNPKRGAGAIPSDRARSARPAARGTRPRRGRAPTPPGGIDLPVIEAVRAMRRRGRCVFDTGVLHGRWRESWSVDGKLVDRAGLLREAARA